ncbi:MAG: hypothetical protein C5B43_03410 [Verrucomicrobia bacterium]|nr:MAG: hypothetical protein C5B43_03410 [Verrucomicrobiota bacterium]
MEKSKFEFSAVIITGGSSGIGASFLDYILKLEQNLVICNLSRRKPEIFEGKENCYHFECDLSKSPLIEEVVPKIKQLLDEKGIKGKILLINNSGFGEYGEFQNTNLSKQLNMINLNVCAVVHLTGLLLPIIIKNGGGIINVSSGVAFQPAPYMATYGATKSFILDWTLAIREDLRETGVRVLALCPGPTSSQFFKRAGFTLGEGKGMVQTPEEVVETAWKAYEADKGFVVSGFRNKLLVCIGKFLPLSFVARISGIIFKKFRKTE